MDKIIEFLQSQVFSIQKFEVAWWMLIVAIVAVLIIVIVIAVCCSKAKRKKEDATDVEELFKDTEAPKTEKPAVEEKAEKEEQKAEEKPVQKKSATKKTTTSKKPAQKAEAKPVKKLNGKWKIVHKKDGEYVSELLASNGEVMLTSEIYSTVEGAKAGIATIIKGVENGNFIIYSDKNGAYYYKLKSAGNKLLCVGEIYKTKEGCANAVESVKRIAKSSPILPEIAVGEEYIDYVPTKLAVSKNAVKGKWKIEKDDNGYSAKLYANNGQLMISTEAVSQKATAEKAVANVKKNAQEGNFIIDKDKFGRFYYKLRNSQKAVICIGEAYEKLESCAQAIESVRRFAEISEIEK